MQHRYELYEIANSDDLYTAQRLRHRVFVLEQGLPADLELDGRDGDADHVQARLGDMVVGTGRVILRDDGVGVIARIAVDETARGRGLGADIVRQLEQIARRRGAQAVELEAHDELEDFYSRLGYQSRPGMHRIGGHDLITMSKSLRSWDDGSDENL